MGWAERVAHTGEKINIYRLWSGDLKVRTHLGELGVDDRIILKCLLKIQDVKIWIKFTLIKLGRNAKQF